MSQRATSVRVRRRTVQRFWFNLLDPRRQQIKWWPADRVGYEIMKAVYVRMCQALCCGSGVLRYRNHGTLMTYRLTPHHRMVHGHMAFPLHHTCHLSIPSTNTSSKNKSISHSARAQNHAYILQNWCKVAGDVRVCSGCEVPFSSLLGHFPHPPCSLQVQRCLTCVTTHPGVPAHEWDSL